MLKAPCRLQVWTYSPDAKLLAALCLYNRLKALGKLPAPSAAAALQPLLDTESRQKALIESASTRRNQRTHSISSRAHNVTMELAKRWEEQTRQVSPQSILLTSQSCRPHARRARRPSPLCSA